MRTGKIMNLSHTELAHKDRCVLRIWDVEKRTGYKRSHIYHMMRKDKFPQNFKIGVRAVGWDSFDIEHWIEQRLTSGATYS